MSRWHPSTCRVCGVSHRVEPISASGLCFAHALERARENNTQMVTKSGEFYDHWLRRSFMRAYASLLQLEEQKAS